MHNILIYPDQICRNNLGRMKYIEDGDYERLNQILPWAGKKG